MKASGVSKEAAAPSTSTSKKRPFSMLDFGMRNLTEKEQADFDEAIAYFTQATGTPFQRLGHDTFKAAMRISNPSTKLPSRKRIGGPLLISAFTKSAARVGAALAQAGYITLTSDAWTSILGLSIINFIAVTREGTFFANCVHAGALAHTAVNMYAMLVEEITKLGGFEKVLAPAVQSATSLRLLLFTLSYVIASVMTACACWFTCSPTLARLRHLGTRRWMLLFSRA
mmetsp:Transcript_29231/g.58344  ORF Transcript_29231/g.58344 Transcript_29231/m.58344 type:complete len:228 (-) Transcript_29231:40-723(-)